MREGCVLCTPFAQRAKSREVALGVAFTMALICKEGRKGCF